MPAMPTTVMATFRVRPGHEEELVSLLRREWSELHQLGLVADTPPQLFRGDEEGGPYFVHLFTWHDPEAETKAPDQPGVADLWRAIGDICEERDGRPAMEFPHVQALAVGH
jgi:hypothetical protein